jgi:hypothetical protein
MGPYCGFCGQRCFVPMPSETPQAALDAYVLVRRNGINPSGYHRHLPRGSGLRTAASRVVPGPDPRGDGPFLRRGGLTMSREFDVSYTITITGRIRVTAEEAYQAERQVLAMPVAVLLDVTAVTVDPFVDAVREVVAR